MKKYIIFLILFLSCFLINSNGDTAPQSPQLTKLTLENIPEIGGITVVKLTLTVPYGLAFDPLAKSDIGCFLPDGVELINDQNYKVIRKQDGNQIIFYSGPLKNGDSKEFIFKIRISDGRKYLIDTGDDHLELDLGDPEPPEWNPHHHRIPSMTNEPKYAKTDIKEIKNNKTVGLIIPEEQLPPLRTDLMIRTEYKHYLNQKDYPKGVPYRYLIYTENETPKANVTLEIPEGLEFINENNYETKTEERDGKKIAIVTLLNEPMRFKQCKAFYFKVKPNKTEWMIFKAIARITTQDGHEYTVENKGGLDPL